MSNEIYFRRANTIIVNNDSSVINFAEVASFDANLRKLGYTLSGDLADSLLHAPVEEIVAIHNEIINTAKELKGVRNYRPMYPKFPKQVMEADEAELYINAILHYFGDAIGVRITPEYATLGRPVLEFDGFEVIKLGSNVEFQKLMGSLLASKSAFSEADRNDINALSDEDFSLSAAHVVSFQNRENKAFYLAQTLKREFVFNGTIVDTATDILRLAVAMSDGNISLTENTKFRSFKRSERRLLLGLLDGLKNPVEDMLRNAQAWKRLGERLHPSEYVQFPVASLSFQAVRENGSFESFNARVENALVNRNYILAVELVKTRPGEFARRLDHLLRTSINPNELLSTFASVASKVSPTVLIQLKNQFNNRDGKRVFFPKGSIAKMQIIEDERADIPESVRQAVVDICNAALVGVFFDRAPLGKVYVDEDLKKVAIPFGQRSASGAIKTLGRGSRLPLDSSNTLRFFIWWKDIDSDDYYSSNRVDIDLSAVALDESFNKAFDITYYNLRDGGAVHSGDITSAPDGGSEFIDIDISKAVANGARYIAMTLHSYTGQSFADIPECFAGFMQRSDPDSGEIYDPRIVTNKVDVTAKSRAATPFIFDLVTGEAIWVDLTMMVQVGYSNVHNSKRTITDVVDAMVNLTPPNLYDLFTLHGLARGELVDRDEADTVYSLDGDVTPFDSEVILSEYL